MKIEVELGVFKNNEGAEVKYIRYYVIVYGVKVYLKPVDKTGAGLLSAVFTNEKMDK